MTPRTLTVSRDDAGKSLLDFLRGRACLSRDEAMSYLRGRKIRVSGRPCSNPEWRLRAGVRVEVPAAKSAPARPKKSTLGRVPVAPAGVVIRHVDDAIVVVEKPAGLTTMRHAEEAAEFGRGKKRFLPDTLADFLPALVGEHLGRPPVRVIAVHRLDKETTGLLVFARTPEAEANLSAQFRRHSTRRRYLALVRGEAKSARIESHLVRDRGDGRRGGGEPGPDAQRAVTHVSVVKQFDGFALVECRLETGRTHQVRIHLGEAGTPLCGERVYDRPTHGRPYTDGSGATRPMLHAASLGLSHPATGEEMSWECEMPHDMRSLLEKIQRGPV